MKRKVYITRKDVGGSKYSGKPVNIWFDSDTPNPPNYKLVNGRQITILSVDEKEHRLVLQRPGFLGGNVINYTVPKGTDDLELTLSVDGYGKLSMRKKPAKKTSSGNTGKTSGTKGILVELAGSTLAPTTLYNNDLYKQIGDKDKEIEKLQTQISDKIDFYTKQFTRLEQLIAQMNNQSSMLMGLTGGY